MAPRRLGLASIPAALGGCHADHAQSALHPAAEAAREIAVLGWLMSALLAFAFLLVMAVVWLAVTRRPDDTLETPDRVRRRNMRFVIAGGVVLPGVVLLAMFFASLRTSVVLRYPHEGLRIQVTGHQWWWDVRYPDEGIVIANEIYLPADEPAVIELRAADVIHSFWVPNLHGKVDLIPEMATRIVLTPDGPGEWRGQCAEFCGRQHAWMALKVVALPRPEFEAWVASLRSPADPEPSDVLRTRGKEVFFEASCHVCHTVEGTRAAGRIGPDLTHLQSRLTLGAGRIENNDDNLARWILDPQGLKPGNLMPATPLAPEDLDALVAYLRGSR